MEKKTMVVLVIVIGAILVGSGLMVALVGFDQDEPSEANVTDAMDRAVLVDMIPQKVVSTSPSTTELIYAMGMGDRLVGVSDYCDYPAAVVEAKGNGSVATIGGYYTPDAEKIAQLQPDIVFIGSDVQVQKDLIPLLEDFNITVVALYEGKNITEVYWNIDLVGRTLFCQDAASDLKSQMTDIISNIRDKIGDQVDKPKVMVTVWLDPIFVAGNGTFVNDIIEIAGGVNAYANMTGFPIINKETVIEANPDVIIVAATMMVSDAKSPADVRSDIMNDELFQETKAVKDGKVYVAIGQAENAFLRPGVRIVDGAQLLAKILYPGNSTGSAIPTTIPTDYEVLIPDPAHTETATSVDMIQVKA